MKQQIASLLVAIVAMGGVAMARSAGPDEQPTTSTCGVDVRKYLQLPSAPHRGNNDHGWSDFIIGRNPVVKDGIEACEPELQGLGFEIKIAVKGKVCGNMWGGENASVFYGRGCLPAGTRYAVRETTLVIIACGNPMELLLRELPPPCLPAEKDCPPLPPPVACKVCEDCPPCEKSALPVTPPPPKGKLPWYLWCLPRKGHGIIGNIVNIAGRPVVCVATGYGVYRAWPDDDFRKQSRDTSWVNDVP